MNVVKLRQSSFCQAERSLKPMFQLLRPSTSLRVTLPKQNLNLLTNLYGLKQKLCELCVNPLHLCG